MPTEKEKTPHPVRSAADAKRWGPGKIIDRFRERRLLDSVVEKDALKHFCDDALKTFREQRKQDKEFEKYFYNENMYVLYSIYSVFALLRYTENPDEEHLDILESLDFGERAILADVENVHEYIEGLTLRFGFSNSHAMRDALHTELNYMLTVKMSRKDGQKSDFDLFQERFNLPIADLAQR